MKINIEIDAKLMKRAMEFSQLKTKEQTVEAALTELIRKHAAQKLIALKGKVEFFDSE